MSLASALNVLRPTLPYYLALTKYGLLHLDANAFEFRPYLPALLIALAMPSASCARRRTHQGRGTHHYRRKAPC